MNEYGIVVAYKHRKPKQEEHFRSNIIAIERLSMINLNLHPIFVNFTFIYFIENHLLYIQIYLEIL